MPSSLRPRLFLGLLLVLTLVSPVASFAAPFAPTAPAAQAGLTMTAQGGYDKNYKIGEWFPILVELANNGMGTVRGRLEVSAYDANGSPTATNIAEVELPSPSRKSYTLYTYAATYTRNIAVRLMQGGSKLLESSLTLEPKEHPNTIVGVVSDDAGLLNNLNGAALGTSVGSSGSPAQVVVAHLTTASLPDSSLGLGGLGALVLAGVSTANLTPDTVTALAGWVVRGGTLVVTGGAAAPATATGVAALLPVRVTGSQPLTGDSLAALIQYSGQPAPPEGGTPLVGVAVLLPERGARLLAGSDALPLVVERTLGAGRVVYLAADPSLPPLRDSAVSTALWTHLLGSTPPALSLAAQRRIGNQYGGYGGYGYSYNSDYSRPFDVTGLQLPNVWLIGAFLVAYLLLIGPFNYLVLRALKRLELAWVTIPVLIVLFVIGAYGIGLLSKGSQLRLIQSSVIHANPDAPVATVDGFVGLFSPSRSSYSLGYTGDVALTEVNSSGWGVTDGSNAAVAQGRGGGVRDLPVSTWALRGFLAEGTVPYTTPFSATLRFDGGHVRGRLLNTGPIVLHDVAVYRGGGVQRLGTLAAGAAVDVDLSLQSPTSNEALVGDLLPGVSNLNNGMAPDPALRRRAAVLLLGLGNASAGQGVTAVGWGAPPPLPVTVGGGAAVADSETVVLTDLPVTPAAGTDLPVDLVPWQVLSGQLLPNYSGSTVPTAQLGDSPVLFQFTLPPDFQPAELTLDYTLGGGVQLEVYNWAAGAYDPFAPAGVSVSLGGIDSNQATTGTITLPNPAPFVGPHGEVLLRLSAPANSYTLVEITHLGIHGKGR